MVTANLAVTHDHERAAAMWVRGMLATESLGNGCALPTWKRGCTRQINPPPCGPLPKFPSDEQFRKWLVSVNLAHTDRHERAAAMWVRGMLAIENVTQNGSLGNKILPSNSDRTWDTQTDTSALTK